MKRFYFSIFILFCLFSSLIAQINLQDGLVAFYPFNGNANDASGNNNHGFVYSATLTSDRFGNSNKAYLFDGSSNYIITPVKSGFTTQISLCAWFKTSYNNFGGILCSRTDSYRANDITTDYNGNPAIHLTDGIPANQPATGLSPAYFVNDDKWHLLVGTYDGSTIKIYIDGLLLAQKTSIFTIVVSTYFKIGLDDLSGSNRYFSGKIDDVRLYNRAINAQEVLALFNEANTSTSVSSLSSAGVNIFPNSSTNSITVSGVPENSEISIFEVSGKLIQKSKLTDNQLNISNIHKGIYLIRLETSSGIKISKVVL